MLCCFAWRARRSISRAALSSTRASLKSSAHICINARFRHKSGEGRSGWAALKCPIAASIARRRIAACPITSCLWASLGKMASSGVLALPRPVAQHGPIHEQIGVGGITVARVREEQHCLLDHSDTLPYPAAGHHQSGHLAISGLGRIQRRQCLIVQAKLRLIIGFRRLQFRPVRVKLPKSAEGEIILVGQRREMGQPPPRLLVVRAAVDHLPHESERGLGCAFRKRDVRSP
jgi:hypothetical protein